MADVIHVDNLLGMDNAPEDQALVLAASREIVPHNLDDEIAINNSDNAGAVSRVAEQTLSLSVRDYHTVHRSKIRKGLVFAVAAIASVSISIHETPHFHHHHSQPSSIDPPDLIEECICKLTGLMNPFAHPAYSDVEDWFLNGPGKSISPPELEDCSWKSDFAHLFALITLRAALNITTASWYNKFTVIESTADICSHHWNRIGCNDNNEIVALHLSNGGFAGTIPSEIGAITTLKHIELYKNFDLKGTIPSEVGSLANLEILHLHQTSLSGSLPTSLGKLTKLQELFIDDTKLEGAMPREICSLRTTDQAKKNKGQLGALHADCSGANPRISCGEDCCNFCYDHHRNHTVNSVVAEQKQHSFLQLPSFVQTSSPVAVTDFVADIKKCQETGSSGKQEECIATTISTGEQCVYCTKNSPNDPDDRTACLTPTLAKEAKAMFKREGIRCYDGGYM